ncbi:MAG: ATP-binding cassette domain-containing protein [Actinomycetota bacterium]
MFLRRGAGSDPQPVEIRDSDGPAVEVADVEVLRGSRVALRDVGFAIDPGTLTAVVGPNGAGKSSLFGALSGRLKPRRGTIRLAGPVAEVLQTTDIDEQLRMTVNDVVRLGRFPARGLIRPMRTHDRDVVDQALALTGMRDLRHRPINELSGGQRQRALVAQGLAQQASVLLLDEPTAGLDRRSKRQLMEIVRAEVARGTTVLFATHDLDEAAEADNLIVMACECVCCAPPIAAMADPAVTALFGPAPRWSWRDTPTAAQEPADVAAPVA